MILVLGGTKSGKSSFASRRAASREHLGRVAYLATAEAKDDEIRDRIRRHQADRPDHWLTVEEPRDPAGYFTSLIGAGPEQPSTVLLDCITMWLTNLLMPLGEDPDRDEALETGRGAVAGLVEAVTGWERTAPGDREAIIISNQVEVGLISPWPLGRLFQDLAGLSHQAMAGAADEVYVMNAGLPLRLR